jgi:VWFA-related protein
VKCALFFVAALAIAQPVFRSDTRAVEVTIIATRGDGAIVKDLRKDEIRVFDNNKEQTIASFERIGSGSGTDAAANRAPQRLTIIILDEVNTSWCDRSYSHDAVSSVLAKLSNDTGRIAIFALGDELHLLHDFSRDTASLKEAADDYEGEQPYIGVDQDYPDVPLICPWVTPEKPRTPFAAFNQELRVSRTLEGFAKIARRMKDFQGEKSLLWVSAAFPPPPAHQEMERVAHELAVAKVKLFPVDPGGLSGGWIGTMQELAEPTGGKVFYGSNDTTALFQAAMDESQQGYVLTFAPKGYREDGSFHYLSLKTSRKGVELSYREGYVASPLGR